MAEKKAKAQEMGECGHCHQPCPKGMDVCHLCAFMAEAEAAQVLPEEMELCEHGLSADLCGGPNHWYDHER